MVGLPADTEPAVPAGRGPAGCSVRPSSIWCRAPSPGPPWPSPRCSPTGASSKRWTGGTAGGSCWPRPTGWPRHLPYHHGHVAGSTIAFFPLFPLSIRWLSDLTGLTPLAAGITITTVTGLTAMVGVWVLVRHYADQSSADRATLLVALFPGSFVLSMVYSEGFALTFLAFGLLALLQKRWLLAGLLGLLASFTTPVALAFEVSCLWCAYRELSTDRRNWRVLAAPDPRPAGLRHLPGVDLAAHRHISTRGG